MSINGSGPWRIDNNAFFISFDKNKLYKIKKNLNIVAFDDSWFIQICNCFYIGGNVLNDQFECPEHSTINKYFEGFSEDYELTCGEKKYYIKEFKVYKIEI